MSERQSTIATAVPSEITEREIIQNAFNPAFTSLRSNLPSDLRAGSVFASKQGVEKAPWKVGSTIALFHDFTYSPEPYGMAQIIAAEEKEAMLDKIDAVHSSHFNQFVQPAALKHEGLTSYDLTPFEAARDPALRHVVANGVVKAFLPAGRASRAIAPDVSAAAAVTVVTDLYRCIAADWPDCDVAVWRSESGLFCVAFDIAPPEPASDQSADQIAARPDTPPPPSADSASLALTAPPSAEHPSRAGAVAVRPSGEVGPPRDPLPTSGAIAAYMAAFVTGNPTCTHQKLRRHTPTWGVAAGPRHVVFALRPQYVPSNATLVTANS